MDIGNTNGKLGEFTLPFPFLLLFLFSNHAPLSSVPPSKCRKESSVGQDSSEPSCEVEIDGQQQSPETEISSSTDCEVRGS